MTPARKRLAILFIAVGIGLIVEHTVASGGDDDDSAAAPAAPSILPRHTVPASAAGPAGLLNLGALASRQAEAAEAPASGASGAGVDSLFTVQAWQPPAPPPAAPEPPPPPAAPPFPYTYLGGMTDDAGRIAFFSQGDRMLTLRGGDTVDGTWRVDHLDDQKMTLTYLPLNLTRVVAAGAGR